MIMQQLESGVMELAQAMPSLAPVVAEFISKLRTALPAALGANAMPGAGMGPMGPQGTPPPPGLPMPPEGA